MSKHSARNESVGASDGSRGPRPTKRWRFLSGLGASGLGALVVVFGLVGGAAAAPCDPNSALEYVAMGDSYSSGYGLPDAKGDCDRSSEYNYPTRVQQNEEFGSFVDVSCAGARTRDFYTAQNASNPPQLDALSESTDVVTFTIGGNDLGFTDILTTCASQGDCRGDYGGPGMPNLITDISGPVGDAIQLAMEDTSTRAPNADVFVLAYPDLLPATPTGAAWSLSCLPTSALISSAERVDLRAVQAALNAEIEQRATAAGARVHYVDTYTPSIGHDLCSSDPWVSLLTLYHPTVTGMLALGAIASQAIQAELTEQCEQSTTTTSSTTSTTTTSSTTTSTTAAPGTTRPLATAPPSTNPPTSAAPAETTTEFTSAPTTAVPATRPSLVQQATATQPTVAGAVAAQPLAAAAQPSTTAPAPAPVVIAQPAAPQFNAQGANGQSAVGGFGQSSLGQAGQPGLASTGARPHGFLVLGAVLLGAGAGLLALNRRRRT